MRPVVLKLSILFYVSTNVYCIIIFFSLKETLVLDYFKDYSVKTTFSYKAQKQGSGIVR